MKRPIIKPSGLTTPYFPDSDSTLMQHVNPRRVRLERAGEYPWVVVNSKEGPVFRQRGVRIPKPTERV